MIESENWLANDEIGSSLTMQTMGNNGVGLSSTMQLMGNNGIGSSLTMQPMDQYPVMYNDSTQGIGSSSTMQPMGNNGLVQLRPYSLWISTLSYTTTLLMILVQVQHCNLWISTLSYTMTLLMDSFWPNDSNEVQELINLYKNQPLQGRTKRGKTLSNYFENDEKKKGEIKVEKYPTWDSRFDYLSEKELQNLTGVVEKRMDKAKGKIELLKSMNVYIGSSSLSHQQIWDYNLMNQTTTLWPISNVNSFTDYNNFFQSNIPISGVNSMGAGMDNGLLTIEDYQFCNANYSMMNEAENWSANDGIGSSLTMQPMANNGIGSSSTMHPMVKNGVGSSSTMQPMGNNGIVSSLTMQLMENGIGSSLTTQPMDQYPFIYTDSTHECLMDSCRFYF
ncbi:hypothetical protein H5410_055880 [Solanum commersonii]|uniref:Mads box protein n=1 Tax=Solanum commersonii TaxID=4109 RepID=A0A9J5WJN7_SOLCO|nr:hypothetical protein H5410_055880 [Solanum commersonii]